MFPLRPPFLGYPFNNFYINSKRAAFSSYNIPDNRNKFNSSKSSSNEFSGSVRHNDATSPVNNDQSKKKGSLNEPFDNYFFEIFGLKLYLDDIIIICLLFFLYEEDVNDQELFISLILLLLS